MGSPSQIIEVKDTGQALVLSLKKQSTRYFDEFLRLRCALDLLQMEIYPNAKEITEAMSVFNAFQVHLKNIRTDDPEHGVVVIGDGKTPRTGAMLAFRTRWKVWSIDPALKSWQRNDIRNLTTIPGSFPEAFSFGFMVRLLKLKRISLVLPHAHVPLSSVERFISRPVVWHRINVLCFPCCLTQNRLFGREADIVYSDWGCWSPKREVLIWKNVYS
jgi:hypothetical protein